MAARGGKEAGVVLLGLFLHYRDDAGRVPMVVSSLGMVHTKAAVSLLVEELHRVPSTNTTRGYLNTVLGALTRLPRALWEPELLKMAQDTCFSPKWRAKFEAALSSQ
jgi:hypothetical protein